MILCLLEGAFLKQGFMKEQYIGDQFKFVVLCFSMVNHSFIKIRTSDTKLHCNTTIIYFESREINNMHRRLDFCIQFSIFFQISHIPAIPVF